MGENNNFEKVFKNKNLRSTNHRNSVLEIMESAEGPVSAENLYLELKKRNVSISLSTVYRILDVLAEKGIIIKTDLAENHQGLYEMSRKDHRHHLICVKCKKVMPVEDCPLHEYARTLEERFGFDITGHRLEMFGYCSKCRDGKESE